MILYLSCTGNTRWAAQTIARALGESLVFIPDLSHSKEPISVPAGERLGFVVPVHGYRPPQILRRLVRSGRISCAADTYIYILYTAGDSIAMAAEYMARDLTRAGLHLDAAYTLIMPETYVGLPFMDVDPPQREREKLQQAGRDIEEYTDDIRHRRRVTKTVRGPLPWLLSSLVGAIFTHWIITDRPFRVSEEQCEHCGVCAAVCPVHNVEGGKGQVPQWKHTGECLGCMACYHHCPHHAIEYGGRTKKKGQYFFRVRSVEC